MKKRRWGCLILFFAMLFSMTAQALDIVCVQSNALGADSDYSIMKATLDNGQTVYYLSMETEAYGKMEDVNFDGYDDFVPIKAMGASNYICMFFLYNPNSGQYEPLYGVEEGFCNYTLIPEKKYVVSSVNDGYQYGETKIYQWQGEALKLLRSATMNHVHTVLRQEDGYTEHWDFSRYEMIVYDHTLDEQEGQAIYHQIYPDNDPQFEEHQALLNTTLWDGL